jgi:glycosyltransferase involved in cell wall biosynthesis
MSEEKLDAFGWLADRTGCGTLRIMQPLDALARDRGYTTAHDVKIVSSAEELPKTLIGQRVCKDGPSQLWFNIGVQKDRPRTVYELDDDLWNVDPSNASAFKWYINGFDDTGLQHNVRGNIARNVAVADYVTCTTEPLADILRQFNPNVHIIPNYLPRWVLDWERPRREELTIGWGGSSTHGMDWDAEGPQIRRFLKRSGVPFRFIGGGPVQAADQLGLPVDQVSASGWIPTVEDYWKTIDFDIGVIPLKHHVFNQSKSHLKFLENAALGIPTVAWDAGPYTRSIEHGKTGFLVKRDHEWGKYLRDLVNDEAMREEIGANAKAWARTQILEDHLDEWAKVLFE